MATSHKASSPQFLLLSMMSYGTGHRFGQLQSAVPTLPPSSFLPTPSQLTTGAEWEKEKVLMLCK